MRPSTVVALLTMLWLAASCASPGVPSLTTYTDTWSWANGDWTQLAQKGPPWREFATSVYYTGGGQWLLFGGAAGDPDTSIPLNDTWIFDGKVWTRPGLATSPPARTRAVAVFEAEMGAVLLFGGSATVVNPDRSYSHVGMNDTWLWKGDSWSEIHPPVSPPAGGSWQAGYDAPSQSVILVGGTPTDTCAPAERVSNLCPDQTWRWDGQNWNLLHPVHQPWFAQVFEDASSGAVMAWGVSAVQFADDELTPRFRWRWSGSDWIQDQQAYIPLPPSPYSIFNPFAATVYGSPVAGAFAFGGSDCSHSNTPVSLNRTWTYEQPAWREQAPAHQPPGRLETYMVYDPPGGQILLWGGVQAVGCRN